MSTLSDRLKSMGVKIGAQDLPRPQRQSFAIDQVVDGRYRPTQFGETFSVEALYPSDYRHGQTGLSINASLQMISEWGKANHLASCDPSGFTFLDTETTGLSGGTGTYAFLVGVGRFSEEGFQLTQFFMRDPSEEPAMLAALVEYLHPCQALVSYNGKAFDAPLLNTRFTLQGMTTPLPDLAHLDLLPLARRLWKDRLPSRRLSYLETSILGAYRTQEEVPGWMIPQMYFDYLHSGDARPMKGVLYHNAMDVVALAALFSRTVEMLAHPLDMDIEDGLDLAAIARLFEELGYLDSAEQIYHRGLEKGLPEANFWDTIERLALLYRKRGDLKSAVPLWEKAAQHGLISAHIELAKFYEHEQRNDVEALHWTQAAIEQVELPGYPPYLRKKTLAELEHRRSRLLKRVK